MGMSLRDARKSKDWSQARLAGEARMSHALLSYAENARFRLSRRQAERLAEALGVDGTQVDELAEALSM
jgi:transcriptional regulator with XRE-family HTH domain